MTGTFSTGKSCLECRRRKIKCDRALPCAYCVKVKIRCTYPPPRKGLPRNGSQSLLDQELASRVENIERTLNSFEHSLSQIWQLVQPVQSQPPRQSSNELRLEVSNAREIQESPASHHPDGQSDVVSREHSVPISQYLNPAPTTIFFLWQRYLERVHPVLRIVHAPSVQRQIMDFIQDQQSDRPPVHCLLFAVYYAAVVTLSTEECKTALEHDRPNVLQRYRDSVEMALAQADFQNSTDTTVLQAFILYTVCARFDERGPDVKNLTRLAIEIAFENGLNYESSDSDIPPFEAEMRCRLWWQIFVLDIRMAEDNRSEPRILESQFHNKFPSNVSDANLDPDMSEASKTQSGKSEMLFSLVRLEISYFARLMVFSDPFCEKNSYPTMSTSDKCEAIDRFKERIELEYLSHCDVSIPLDFVTIESSHLILAKLKLTVSKPRNRESQQLLAQESFRGTCVEILERAKAMRLHERSKQWLWLFQTYIEWDALTYLLISLSLSPLGEGADTVWRAAQDIYQYWNGKSGSHGCSRWCRIEEFHAQALIAREMALSNPNLFGTSSNRRDLLEDSESMAMGSPEPISLDATQTEVSGPAILPTTCASQPDQRPESPIEQQRHMDNMGGLANTQTAIESSDIPSSGTACQWSTPFFERYFEVLDSDVAASWF